MIPFIKCYFTALLIFLILDSLWLGVIAKNLYATKLSHLLSPNVNWVAAILFYLIYIGGIVYFAIYPSIELREYKVALLNGAFLGFLCYATYDFTNYATLKDWPLSIVIYDLLWGTFITMATSIGVYLMGFTK